MPTEGLSLKEIYDRQMGPILDLGIELSRLGGVEFMRAALIGFSVHDQKIISYAWEGHGGWSDPANKEMDKKVWDDLINIFGRP